LIAVLVLGLGAGGATAFAISKLNPVFDSVVSLRTVTGLPVLGAVSATWLDRRLLRRRVEMLRVAAASAALLVAFIGVVLVRDPGSRFLINLAG
jgi:hypothetical protein